MNEETKMSMNTARNWKRMAWLSYLSYYRNKYGRDWDGELKMSDEELKTEWLIYLSDKAEERKKREWNGQYSSDEQYEGVINEELFIKHMDQYKTSDLFLASYLFAKEHGIEGIDDTDSRRKEFIFNNTEQLQLDKASYWDGTAKMSPLKLFNAMKNLKNMIYSNV